MARSSMTDRERLAVCAGVLGVVLISAIDIAIGYEINLVVLHLLPVLLVTWFVSARWGVFLLALMTVIGVLAQSYLGHPGVPAIYRYLDLTSNFAAISILIFMQSRLRQAYRKVSRQARSDALTGCLHRGAFHEQIQNEIALQRRYGRAYSILCLDVDGFRAINEAQGHQAGDALLAEVGRALRARLRRTDNAGRMGADEFALLLRETDLDAARRVATALKEDLERVARGHRWPVRFSMGVVSFSRPPQDADMALRLMEEVMHEAKQEGRDAPCIKVY